MELAEAGINMTRRAGKIPQGSRLPQLFAAKRAFDPDALLAPGQGVFTPG